MEEKVCQEGTSSATSENLQEQERTGASSHPFESEIIITVRPEKTEAEASSDPAPEIAESRMVEEDEEKERSKNGENKDCAVNSGNNETVNDEDRVCRICHLNHDHHSILIQLGCSCKDELGISHPHCAETWFKHKGNRRCEICGETAQNVVGFREKRHTTMERNQRRVTVRSSTSSSDRVSCCGRKGCNLFLTGLVLAFLFIWMFHLP